MECTCIRLVALIVTLRHDVSLSAQRFSPHDSTGGVSWNLSHLSLLTNDRIRMRLKGEYVKSGQPAIHGERRIDSEHQCNRDRRVKPTFLCRLAESRKSEKPKRKDLNHAHMRCLEISADRRRAGD